MASRPVAIPEVFTGEGGQTWSDWRDHFDSVAEVNGWSAADKKWVRARLTRRAATAMRCLSEDDKASFDTICAALKKRFEPDCRKEVFMAEFQTRTKRRNEDWASFAEDLKTLVEKAYPTLQQEAQELLALNHLLSQIGDPQLSFAVRQRSPVTVDAAVAAVLELETYLRPQKAMPVAPVVQESEEELEGAAASVTRRSWKDDPMRKIMDRLDKLEAQMKPSREEGQGRNRQRRGPTKTTCWNCKEDGHISRNCPENPKKQETFAAVSWATECPRQAQNIRSLQPSAMNVTSQESNTDWLVEVQVNGVPTNCLVDTGAGSTILSRRLWE